MLLKFCIIISFCIYFSKLEDDNCKFQLSNFKFSPKYNEVCSIHSQHEFSYQSDTSYYHSFIQPNDETILEIYLIRHATPDYGRKEIRYDIIPGPPLTAGGVEEAKELSKFLIPKKISKIYSSPLERTKQTAEIIASILNLQCHLNNSLVEWRRNETKTEIAQRVLPFWEHVLITSQWNDSVVIVTHGGLIKTLLEFLGLDINKIKEYGTAFGYSSPLPPAGVWKASRKTTESKWEMQLVYVPKNLNREKKK